MDKILVRILKWSSPLFARQGVDTDRLFVIVEAKLKMDKRRTYIQAGARRNRNAEKDTRNRFLLVLLLYAFFSVSMAMMIANMPDLILSMSFFHAYLLFMMAITLITDFSSVMLDTADNQIILSRPVNSKTIFAARMVHVFIYVLQFAIAICLIPVCVIFYIHGAHVGLASIATSFSTILLAVFFTWFLYMMVLRYSSEKKLKDIITYFQIGATVFFAVSYQIMPRMISFTGISAHFTLHRYSYIAPPVWMATVLDGIHKNLYDSFHISMILLVIGLPPLLFWLMNKYLAPSFSRKIAMINSDAGTREEATGKDGKQSGPALSAKLCRLFCKTSSGQAAFQLTWKITSRDKQFRLQFYPSIGYLFVFIFIFIFKGGRNAAQIWDTLGETNNFLWAIYVPLFMILSASTFIKYHENYQAAWVYLSSPVAQPGTLIAGAVKAIFVKYCIPVFTGFFIISLAIWGVRIIDDFILGFFVLLNCLFFAVRISKRSLPFSLQFDAQQQSGRWIATVLQMITIGAAIGLHYLALLFPILMFVLIPLMILAAWLLLGSVEETRWPDVVV